MGWAGGSEVFGGVALVCKKHIKDAKVRKKMYRGMLKAFEAEDWDTQSECAGIDPVLDEVLAEFGYLYDEDEEEP